MIMATLGLSVFFHGILKRPFAMTNTCWEQTSQAQGF